MIRLSGRLRCSLIIGGQGIRAHKLRTLLSMLSLFLGVLAIVAVQASAEIAQARALADIELTSGRDGTLQVYLPPSPSTLPIVLDTLAGRTDGVASYTVGATIGEPGVTSVNPGAAPFDDRVGPPPAFAAPAEGSSETFLVCDPRGFCKDVAVGDRAAAPPGQAIELVLTGLTGDIRPFRPFRPRSGQWLDFTGPPSLAPRIVINEVAAKGFNRYAVPAEMRVEGATANSTPRIVGVIDDGSYQPTAYVRADELFNWLPTSRPDNGNGPGVGDLRILLAPAAADLEQTLRSRLVAAGVPAQQIHAERVRARESIAEQLALVRWIFLGMAALVLLIGVAGILNVGLATVGERVEEFALRRAVGTPRSLLAGIVLAETLLTGLFTAGAAIGVGVLGLHLGGEFLAGPDPSLRDVEFPWQAGVAGVLAGLIAGLLGGLIPAIRAARIPIATIMRA